MYHRFTMLAPRFALALLALAFGGLSPTHSADPPASILISGGSVIDGTGAKARRADVRVAGDKIVEVGKLKAKPGERVVDARGLTVCPGFIDAHSHADGGLMDDLNAEAMVRQGITTSVVGQDGGSHFPLKDWFGQLEKTPPAINIASFVGHGTLRGKVLGDDYKRASTPGEVEKMAALVGPEMDAGALGLSSGLEYDPGLYATTEEVVAMAREAGKRGGIYISHVRDEENEALTSFRELIRIADEGHLPAQISHIKLGSSPVWGKAPAVQQMMADARRWGLDITADVYPYLYWQSTITVIIPTRHWEDRAQWTQGLAEIGGPGHVLLTTYSPNPSWEGKTIAEIAEITHRDAVTVIQDIVNKTHGDGVKDAHESVVVTAMTEPDLATFLRDPRIMFCTDGGLHPSHPRGAGSFPRILGVYVRQKHLLTLEQAVHKATQLPAQRFGFQHRGTVTPGAFADLVLFNPKTILDTATTAHPAALPIGLPIVFVNGAQVLENGQPTGLHGGRVLRRGH